MLRRWRRDNGVLSIDIQHVLRRLVQRVLSDILDRLVPRLLLGPIPRSSLGIAEYVRGRVPNHGVLRADLHRKLCTNLFSELCSSGCELRRAGFDLFHLHRRLRSDLQHLYSASDAATSLHDRMLAVRHLRDL